VKRHRALVELSRDHQHALAIAQGLRRATSRDAPDAAAAFQAFWKSEGRMHFRIEEELLLPAFASRGDARNPAVVQVLVDHVEIRSAARRVATKTASLVELHKLGDRLAAHVRLEERELFPLIEATLTERELDVLGVELLAAAR
jgi:iron-sulfur cluster repair protein YtfE (RIC family)